MFVSYNKNKKSVEMNLAAPEGKAVIYEMAKQADVVIENFKSGSIDRLGLGYEKLKELNPRLVFISLSGFGASGPLRKLPCYDAIAEARSGFAASNGDPEGPPMKAGNCIGDTITGLYGLNAVLMALIASGRTGQGGRIDMSMMAVGMQACEETIMDFSLHGQAQARFGDHDRFTAPYGMFEARDGWCVIIADTEARWRALCGALDHPEWMDDPRFKDNASRVAHKDHLVAAVTSATVLLRRAELAARLLAVDVPASAVLSFIEAYTSDHANQTGLTQLVDQKKIGLMRFYSNPIRFDNETIPIRRALPCWGRTPPRS
jgi:crotonobetainyl-CoA:carnitine CoA-transferase CaiB-like acyl-CoA transferase